MWTIFQTLAEKNQGIFFLARHESAGQCLEAGAKKIRDIPSVGEIKAYQKHLRKKTFGWVFTSAMAAMLVISLPGLFQKYFSHAKGYQWVQNSWAGIATTPAGTAVSGTLANSWNEWTNYFSKTGFGAIKTSVASALQLQSYTPSVAVGENGTSGTPYTQQSGTTIGYSGGTGANGSGAYAPNGSALGPISLKKPVNATCGSTYECATNICTGNTCMGLPCSATSICGQYCSYNGNNYATVQIGTQCWFAENLRTTKAPDGTDITSLTGCNPAGCGSPWGLLYFPGITLYPSDTGATGPGQKIQGICPAGWHIPSNYGGSSSDDFQVLSNYLGTDTVSGSAMKQTGTTYWTTPNNGATNSSGFSAVAAGKYAGGDTYTERGNTAYFISSYWSAPSVSAVDYLSYNNGANGTSNMGYAMSVRCIKN